MPLELRAKQGQLGFVCEMTALGGPLHGCCSHPSDAPADLVRRLTQGECSLERGALSAMYMYNTNPGKTAHTLNKLMAIWAVRQVVL
jgi:hypothetical protein